MRKLWITLRILTAMNWAHLSAQQIVDDSVAEDFPVTFPGEAASSSARAAETSSWQTWVIAGASILGAAIGIALVAANSGSAVEHE